MEGGLHREDHVKASGNNSGLWRGGFGERIKGFSVWAILLTLLMFLGAAGCDNSDVSSPPESKVDFNDPQLETRLQAALRQWADECGVNGAAIQVYSPGRYRWMDSYGFDVVETQTPYEIDTKARIGSATKPFTAVVILQLIDEGRLSLDTPLSQFLPDYPNGGAITVEHLLGHRSGIPELQLDDLTFIQMVLSNQDTWLTPEEIMAWTYKDEPMFSLSKNEFVPRDPVTYPGGDYHYAQPNYTALGLIIEEITGRSAADVFAERIFNPLGMTDTHLAGKEGSLEPMAYTNLFGMQESKSPITDILTSANSYHSAMLTAGGIISTAGDLMRFLASLLDGRILSPSSLNDMMDWRVSHPDGYGLNQTAYYGLGFSREIRNDYTIIGHNGSTVGSGSVMKYIPELDVYVTAVRNSDKDSLPEETPDLLEYVKRALLNETYSLPEA